MTAEVDPNSRCPRCGGSFACGAAGPVPCACTTVTLSAAALAQLRASFQGCLCPACLRVLARADTAGDRATQDGGTRALRATTAKHSLDDPRS